jgi:hypothetical protein
MWEAEIERIMVLDQLRQKIFSRSHHNGKKRRTGHGGMHPSFQ